MVVDRLASVDDGSCVPKVYGCTDPLAVNFDQAANSYDNTGVLGERCRAARCVRGSSPHAIATAALPVCPTGWTGPRGGLCVRHVGNLAETQPWHCADGGSVVEFGDGAGQLRVDECSTDGVLATSDPVGPCNAPDNRLCVAATGTQGFVGPDDCTNVRPAFHCGEDVPTCEATHAAACGAAGASESACTSAAGGSGACAWSGSAEDPTMRCTASAAAACRSAAAGSAACAAAGGGSGACTYSTSARTVLHTDPVQSVDETANTITLPAADAAIVAGTEVLLTSAAGQSCASAVATPLTVTQVTGAVVSVGSGIAAPDANAATNCVLTVYRSGYRDFACHDPNPYWPGDYTCGCAFDYEAPTARHVSSVSDTCGAETAFSGVLNGADTTVSNYDLTLYLSSRVAARNHLCQQLGNPARDCVEVTGKCSGNSGFDWSWGRERDVVCADGFELKPDSHTIDRGAGYDFHTAEARTACCVESACTAAAPSPVSGGYGVGPQHGVLYAGCVDGEVTGKPQILRPFLSFLLDRLGIRSRLAGHVGAN